MKIKNALRHRRAFWVTGGYKELQQVLAYFLINRNMPKSDNRSCRCGLALGFGLHEDACSISKHIERYSTTHGGYVNDFVLSILIIKIFEVSTILENARWNEKKTVVKLSA